MLLSIRSDEKWWIFWAALFPALPHVKRIERRVRRNNCLICPFACRCPNHSRLIQKMQAWMSEGLLRRGGAFQRLWTAVPLVITTLNLAGHSSTPLIEHLSLTRCYCRSQRFCGVLTNQRMVPDHHRTFLFSRLSRAWCRQIQAHRLALEREIVTELKKVKSLKNLIIYTDHLKKK